MTAECPDLATLLDAGRRESGDPDRSHLETCPRCRNRLALYHEFEHPTALPVEADLADAERRLAESLAGLASPSAVRGPLARPRPEPRGGLFRGIASVLFGPGPWRVALAGGGLLAAALIVFRPWQGANDAGVLRGSGERVPALAAAAPLADGRVHLTWSADPDAEAYRVRVLGPDLVPLLSRDVTTTSLDVDRSALTGAVAPGTVLGWNVAVLRGGGEIRRSATGTLRAP
jgi:hypothetical protein